MSCSFAHAFARSFNQTARTQSGFKYKYGITSACFPLDESARRFAADFFVRGPEEDDAFAEGNPGFANGVQSEEGLHDARFHVECTGAVGFAGFQTERHFGERAGGINGVVVTKNEELRFGEESNAWPDKAKMIAAMLLSNDADDSFAMKPEVGEKPAAAIGGTFFRTGRFVKDQLVQSVEHLRKTWAQELQKSFGER